MSFSNPRRTPVTRPISAADHGLKLKTNLALRKGATFHSPMTPPSSPPSASFRVPSLPRRSQTNLDDVVDAHVRRAALTIESIEDRLTSTDLDSTSSRRSFRDDSLPIPQGFLDHTVADTMSQASASQAERRVLRPRNRRTTRHHESDSGLGTSIASTTQKQKETKPLGGASAITRSVTTSKSESSQRLSSRGVNRIHEHILKPLLAKPSLKDFRPIVLDCPRQIQENQIICLRDLEKTLIFMAPVSKLLKDPGVWGVTYRSLCSKERAKSAESYLDFCLTSIRCIQATVEYLNDREETRPNDRPYSNGYFIDLVEQIRQHANEMRQARERQASGEELGEMDVDPTDELKLIGGIADNGRPAELVRVKKNGKGYSYATGKPIDNLDKQSETPPRFKRSMSQQLEDEEEIMRSMARRKKNASPEELAPKKCTHAGCHKEFKRPCDLTKHEKTHSRPWKCPHTTCKYHEYGWPTEKEMDRHINDKHSAAPPMFECQFKPCPYKSKRESNCKQHMEKAHGWTYVRTKSNKPNSNNKTDSKAGSSAQPTPMVNNLPTPSSDHTDLVMTPPDDHIYEGYNVAFPTYPTEEGDPNRGLFDYPTYETDIHLDLSPVENGTPSTDGGQFHTYQELSPEFTGQFEDIYGAPMQLPTPTHAAHAVFNKMVPEMYASHYPAEVCPPVSAPHISPGGQGNQMLYTPSSLAEVDEGFEEYPPAANGEDFLLFPPQNTSMIKSTEFDNVLFGSVPPSLAAGFTQPSSQDFNIDYNQPMMWTSNDFQSFHHQ
ncbi:hypothetical protein F4778DRAFT_768020 [Xylariomycetidae sp. FL2044]|nr:hypothetical protein F4778DRAFT_768020 [Xylariomycetidae sp. FL2044]